MTELNLNFTQDQVLTHGEMNSIADKINEIVRLLSSLDTKNSGITDAQVQDKVDAIKNELSKNLQDAVTKLTVQINELKDLPEGASQTINAETWAQYRKKIDGIDEYVTAIKETYKGIDLTSMKETLDKFETWASSISIEPDKIAILTGLFKEDENGNSVLSIPPAAIIASITESDDKTLISQIEISAGNIIVNGEMNLSEKLNAISADIQKLDVTEMANIKAAVVDSLTGTTISGVNINGGSINIGDGDFTVDSDGNVVANSITISGQGHILFIEPGGTYTLPEAKAGSTVHIVNKYPTANPATAAYITVKTKSYDNFKSEPNYNQRNDNSFIRVFYDNTNDWDMSIVPTACRLGNDCRNLVSAILVGDGKDWWEVSRIIAKQ